MHHPFVCFMPVSAWKPWRLIFITDHFSGPDRASGVCVCVCRDNNFLSKLLYIWLAVLTDLTLCSSSSKVKVIGQSSRLRDKNFRQCMHVTGKRLCGIHSMSRDRLMSMSFLLVEFLFQCNFE